MSTSGKSEVYKRVPNSENNQPKEDAVKTNPGGLRKNLTGLLILTLLYTIQGIPLSFFKMSIPAVLIEKGAHFKDLSIISIAGMPYALKFLIAPFLDTFYFKKFGQRKSYIVPLQYMISIISFVLCYHLKEYVDNFNMKAIFIWALASITMIAIQDVAVDGWVLTLLTEDYLSYGPATQTIGIMLGNTLAYNVFIPLNSTYFCNKYFFSTPREEPLITIGSFWYITGIFTLIVTIFVHFFVKEKEIKNEDAVSLKSVINVVRLFYRNPNLRIISIICLTSSIASMPMASFFETLLIQQGGVHKETLANITTALFPVEIIASIYVGRICRKNQELKLSLYGYLFSLAKTFFQLFVLLYFFSTGNNMTTNMFSLILGIYIFTIIQKQISMIALSSFSNKISNEASGTTFVSTRTAIGGIGVLWVRAVALYLGEYLPWYTITGAAAVFGIFYFLWLKGAISHLQTVKKEEFYVLKKD